MPNLGIGASLSRAGLVTPGIVTRDLIMRHNYATSEVVPISDGAAYFNGTSSNIQLANAISHNTISISAWIYVVEDNDTKTILDARDADNNGIFFEVNADEILVLHVNGSDTGTPTLATITPKVWTHVAGTYDGTNLILYKNGTSVEVDPDDGSSETVSTTTAARIGKGAYSDGFWFSGYLCNVGVWSGVLTQAQVKSIMNKNYASLSTSEKTNLVSWWNLDETIHTAADGLTHVHDNHYGGTDAELGAELWSNVNFDDTSAWTDQNPSVSADESVALSTEQVKNGSYSLKITVDAAGDGTKQTVTATTGKLYKVSGWFYVLSGVAKFNPDDSHFTSGTEILTTKTNEWEYISGYLKATATGTVQQVYIQASSAGATFYVDSVSFKEVQGNIGELK